MDRRINPRRVLERMVGVITLGWYYKDDEKSVDRRRLLLYGYTSNLVANLIGGNFYTGLLLLMGADDAFIGLMSMFTLGANTLQILAPLLLERFPQRKLLLIGMRWANLAVNIVGVGLLPLLSVERALRLALLAVAVLTINLLNAASAPGFSIWHIQFVPSDMRARFFSITSMTNGLIVALINLLGAHVVDLFKAGGNEFAGLSILRGAALVLAVADGVLLLRMKEYPYLQDRRINLVDLFLQPFKERKYLLTIIMACMWHFTANISGPYLTIYLLKDLQVPYAFITLVAMANVPVLILLTPLWRRVLARLSWFRTLGIGMALYLLAYVVWAFVTKETVWLYPVTQLIALVMAVGINLSFANIPYVNIPEKSQTIFISFYSTMANLTAVLGVWVGRSIISAAADFSGTIFGLPMGDKQLLSLIVAGLMAVGAAVVLLLEGKYGEKITPSPKLPKKRRRRWIRLPLRELVRSMRKRR